MKAFPIPGEIWEYFFSEDNIWNTSYLCIEHQHTSSGELVVVMLDLKNNQQDCFLANSKWDRHFNLYFTKICESP
jgi:hypothetical protein